MFFVSALRYVVIRHLAVVVICIFAASPRRRVSFVEAVNAKYRQDTTSLAQDVPQSIENDHVVSMASRITEQRRHDLLENAGAESSNFEPAQFEHWQQPERSLVGLGTPVNRCSDLTKYFQWNGGLDVLQTYYDCQCTPSNFTTYPQFVSTKCVLSNYCMGLGGSSATNENCFNHEVNINFELNTTTKTIHRADHQYGCLDYLTDGPDSEVWGSLCYRSNLNCARKIREDFDLTFDETVPLCADQDRCPDELVNTYGYTSEQADFLCPSRTLNGLRCNTYGTEECGQRNATFVFRSTPDCANVASCVAASCQERSLAPTNPDQNRFPYDACDMTDPLDVGETSSGPPLPPPTSTTTTTTSTTSGGVTSSTTTSTSTTGGTASTTGSSSTSTATSTSGGSVSSTTTTGSVVGAGGGTTSNSGGPATSSASSLIYSSSLWGMILGAVAVADI